MIIAGLWSESDDADTRQRRRTALGVDHVAATLRGALERCIEAATTSEEASIEPMTA